MNQQGFVRIVLLSVIVGLLAGCHTDPNVRKRKYLASGERYSAEGKYREAAIQYQNSLKADKDFPDAHYALGKAYMHIGAFTAAYREFSRTVELQPKNVQARLDLANLLLAGGQVDKAEEQAKAVQALQQDNADLHALLSAIAIKRGDQDKAIAEMRRALQLAPNRAMFYDDLGLLQEHDPSQAAEAESNFKNAVTADPKSVDPKLLLSGYYFGHNRLAEAEQVTREAIAANPKSLAARTLFAQIYLREGNASQAEQVLRQASQDLSADPRGVRVLADYYTASGQYDKAQSEFASLVSRNPKNFDLQKGYLRALLQVRDYANAQTVAKKLMKEDPSDPETAALNGIVLLGKGDSNDAVNALQEGAKDFPQDPFIQYWLGMAALSKGDTALAQKSFQQVVTLKPTAVNALEQLARLAERQGETNLLTDVAGKTITALPNFAGGYIWRATAEMHQNNSGAAEADLKTAMRLAPRNPQAYFELGQLRFAQKRFPEGEALLEQSLQLDPDQVQAMRMLIGYDMFTKHPEKAFARLNSQIQERPKNSGMLDLLAALQSDENKLSDAAATAQKAMQINPGDAEAAELFTRTAVQRGQTGAAINVWQSWTNAHPNDANAIALLASLEDTTGNTQKAQADYQRALQIQPQQPIAANNLAYLMLQNGGNIDVALSLAQIARQGMPNSPDAADTLAWAYYQKGTYQFARDLLEDALKQKPDSATMQYHLGMVYSKLRDNSEAATHLKKAITLGQGTPTAGAAQAALQHIS
jgi:tetratricopeptide (TPR) repeat protein